MKRAGNRQKIKCQDWTLLYQVLRCGGWENEGPYSWSFQHHPICALHSIVHCVFWEVKLIHFYFFVDGNPPNLSLTAHLSSPLRPNGVAISRLGTNSPHIALPLTSKHKYCSVDSSMKANDPFSTFQFFDCWNNYLWMSFARISYTQLHAQRMNLSLSYHSWS